MKLTQGPAILKPNQVAKNAVGRDRRIYDRYPLGDASGVLIYKGDKSPCHLVDISLEGCCIRTKDPFPHGALAYVEVVLSIYGMVLRIGGMTQWTRSQRLVGVRFILPTTRAKNELAGLLTCIVDREAAEEIKDALASVSVDPLAAPILAAQFPAIKKSEDKPAPPPTAVTKPLVSVPPQSPEPSSSAPRSEAPDWTGEEPNWTADMRFIKDGSHLRGKIVNLHMDGCGFLLPDAYKGDYPCRVEVEFQMRGLPFRVGGVTEYIEEKNTVGVRFLNMIQHRREKLEQLLEEIREEEEKEAAAEAAEAAEAAAAEEAASSLSEEIAADVANSDLEEEPADV